MNFFASNGYETVNTFSKEFSLDSDSNLTNNHSSELPYILSF